DALGMTESVFAEPFQTLRPRHPTEREERRCADDVVGPRDRIEEFVSDMRIVDRRKRADTRHQGLRSRLVRERGVRRGGRAGRRRGGVGGARRKNCEEEGAESPGHRRIIASSSAFERAGISNHRRRGRALYRENAMSEALRPPPVETLLAERRWVEAL